jgi:hypothetical protein
LTQPGAAQAHEQIGQGLQPRGSWWQAGGVLKPREEVVMSQEEPVNRAVAYNHFDFFVGFERRDDFI